jgi:redox-sensitive bicupin YhaK (pirin superfamily)
MPRLNASLRRNNWLLKFSKLLDRSFTEYVMSTRTLQQVIPGMPTSDGAGVKLRRSLGASQALRLDPFLMLDEFSSENPDDYVAGFPAHPHRGFETVTYMLDGHMRHEDHMGNVGELKSGGVQWMTAGRGIIHSEMPQQERGRMRGFQLWINLPADEKMKPAGYRDIQPAEIPAPTLANGGQVKVIAGSADIDGRRVAGPIQGLTTEALYLDVHLPAGASFTQALPQAHNAFVYTYEGGVSVGPEGAQNVLPAQSAGVLSPGDTVTLTAGAQGARLILLAAKPLREPVVQYGPFVMNTREQIEQAISDYQNGTLAQAA